MFTVNVIVIAATHALAAAVGCAITVLAYKIGQRSDRLTKLIDKSPQILQGVTNIIGNVRDMIEAEKQRRN